VAEIGERIRVIMRPPPPGFFKDETLEIARVARRLAVDGEDPDGEAGHVSVSWFSAPSPHSSVRLLAGKPGEERIRSHFHDPRCPWANRHVAWQKDLWILEYVATRPWLISFTLDTSTVVRPGLVSGIWKGHGAFAIESIHPNGFGGTSENRDLPPLLVIPRGTAVREVSLP
jgi:hypothetical protein